LPDWKFSVVNIYIYIYCYSSTIEYSSLFIIRKHSTSLI
jgi:hypothetical protein